MLSLSNKLIPQYWENGIFDRIKENLSNSGKLHILQIIEIALSMAQ